MKNKKLTISVANMPDRKTQEKMLEKLSEYLKIDYERGNSDERNS